MIRPTVKFLIILSIFLALWVFDDAEKNILVNNKDGIKFGRWIMKTNIEWPVKESEDDGLNPKEVQRRAERIWKAISRCATSHIKIEKDAIFKDPDWPHLWDHKR